MSRSIHLTWRAYYRAQKKGASPEKLEEMREQLYTKHRLKKAVTKKRKQRGNFLDQPPVSPDVIPIRVAEQGPHIHYPATEKDLRAVMSRLPVGVMNGIDEIVFSLGMSAQKEEHKEEVDPECDPIFGRPGSRFLPGIWQPPILGLLYSARISYSVICFCL